MVYCLFSLFFEHLFVTITTFFIFQYYCYFLYFFKKFNLIKSLFITILIYFLIIKASLGLIYLKNNLNINIVKIEDKFIEHVNENSNLKS